MTIERTREDGRARVVSTLVQRGPLSRADLARHAGLAPSTVTGLVATLQAEGLVTEGERALPGHGPGRPATLLALRREAGVVVGLDFGRRHVTAAVSDLAHTILAERSEPLRAGAPAVDQVARARALAHAALAEAGCGAARVVGIAAGIPGPVHRPTGHLGDLTILPEWVDVPAERVLAEAFGRPVQLENDANLGALGEWVWGAAQQVAHLVYVKLSTGIGGGLVVEGQLLHGAGGTAGEIGHVVIDPNGPECRCGRRGCLEAVTGSTLVVDRARAGRRRVDSVRVVVELADAGDAAAREALAHCGEAVGRALGGVCNVLNPELVLLGGELAAAGPWIADPVRRALAEASLRSVGADLRVELGRLGPRAEVLGAIALALRTSSAADLLLDPSDSPGKTGY